MYYLDNLSYDKDKDYNKQDNDNYIPPYRSAYKSVYEGIELEMHVVNHCNLNCAACNHFSPIADPWFISIEDFQNQLIAAKENISTIKQLMLLGGEPSLHPNIGELGRIAREIFPDTTITILSNGCYLDNLERDVQIFIDNNIFVSFCSYPNHTKFKQIEALKLPHNYFNTRVHSLQTLVVNDGSENKENNFYNCFKHKLPCFTLKDYKIYLCPFAAHLEHYFKKQGMENILEVEGVDYLDVNSIQNNLDILHEFCFTPKNFCKYCSSSANYHIWHKSYEDVKEYSMSLDELYNSNNEDDYNRYEELLISDKDYYTKCISPEDNPGRVDETYNQFGIKFDTNRFFSKVDLIIPYYNVSKEIAQQLYETISKQTFLDNCAIYLIDDGSNQDSTNYMQFFFKNSPISERTVFLRNIENMGPGPARNRGFKNSFGEFIFCLDADDYFLNENSLEALYNLAISKELDLLRFTSFADNGSNGNKDNFFIRRNYLEKHQIKFYPFYFGEDYIFNYQLLNTDNKKFLSVDPDEQQFCAYGQKNYKKSLTGTFSEKDPLHFSFISSKILINFFDIKDYQFYSDFTYSSHLTLKSLWNNDDMRNKSDFFKLYCYFLWYLIYKNDPDFVKKYVWEKGWYISFSLNSFYYRTKDQIELQSKKEIFNYLKNYITENYLNDKYLKGPATEILNILDILLEEDD